jgi:hypothetical protein
MKRTSSSPKSIKNKAAGMTIGRERFAKISAVEGITLTPAMKRRVAQFDRQGLSATQRRRAIIAAHRKD